jgi:O-antigen/teichoic acid export membrane protein
MVREWVNRSINVLGGSGLGSFLVRSVAGTGAVRIASMVASFGVGVQLARGLGVSGYGYYGIALSVITLCAIPAEMGLPRLVTREVAAAAVRKDMPHLFGVIRWASRVGVRISLVMAVGIVAGALILGQLRPSILSLALVAGAPIVPFMVLSRVHGGALQGLHHIVRGQIPANFLRPVALSLLLLFALTLGFNLSPAAAIALNAVSAGLAFLVARHWLAQRLPKAVPAELVRGGVRWLASSIPMALTDGMRILQSELTILLLGILTAPAEVGLFRVAAATAFAAATPIAVINHVAFPVIARLHAEQDAHRLQKAVTGLAQAQFIGVLLLCLPLIIAPEPLLTLVFGSDYAPAAKVLRILALAQVVNAAFGPNVALLNMTHNERRVARAMAIGLVLNVAAVLLLGLVWGRMGAALAVFGSLLVWNLLTWIDGKRILGIDSSLVRPAAA